MNFDPLKNSLLIERTSLSNTIFSRVMSIALDQITAFFSALSEYYILRDRKVSHCAKDVYSHLQSKSTVPLVPSSLYNP